MHPPAFALPPPAEVDTAAPPAGEFVSFPGSPFQLYQPYAPAGDQPVRPPALALNRTT